MDVRVRLGGFRERTLFLHCLCGAVREALAESGAARIA
jgi:hypothetical protein